MASGQRSALHRSATTVDAECERQRGAGSSRYGDYRVPAPLACSRVVDNAKAQESSESH
jgi:hypothetical protein